MQIQAIENRMYEIRGQKIILDFDLAHFFQTDIDTLRQSVKKNLDRFPKDFMFRLNKKEWKEFSVDYNLRQQITDDTEMPFVFTEYGIIMLATVLSSKKSIQLNIAIVKAFAELKEFL